MLAGGDERRPDRRGAGAVAGDGPHAHPKRDVQARRLQPGSGGRAGLPAQRDRCAADRAGGRRRHARRARLGADRRRPPAGPVPGPTWRPGSPTRRWRALLAGLVSLYDVDGGTVFLAEEDGLSLRRAAAMRRGRRPTASLPSASRSAKERWAARRWSAALSSSTARAPRATPVGRTTIYAPMVSSGKLVGVICLTTRPSRLTGRGELLLLQAFANRVGEILVSASGDPRGRLEGDAGALPRLLVGRRRLAGDGA